MELKIFSVSSQLMTHFPFAHVTPHDSSDGDWEHPDRLWIEYTPEDSSCEGEYIFVGMTDKDGESWCVGRCDANRSGGHPLLWEATGNAEEVTNEVIAYLHESQMQSA